MVGQAQPVGYKQFKGMLATVFKDMDTPFNLTDFTQMVARTNSVSVTKRDFSRAVRDFKQSSRCAILACTSCGNEYLFPTTTAVDERACPICVPQKKDEPTVPTNSEQSSLTPYKLGRLYGIMQSLRKKYGDAIVSFDNKRSMQAEISTLIDDISLDNAYWYVRAFLQMGAAEHNGDKVLLDTTHIIHVPQEDKEPHVTKITPPEQQSPLEQRLEALLPDSDMPTEEALVHLLDALRTTLADLLQRDETIDQLYTQLTDSSATIERLTLEVEVVPALQETNTQLERTLAESRQQVVTLEQQLAEATVKKVNLRQLYAEVSDKP